MIPTRTYAYVRIFLLCVCCVWGSVTHAQSQSLSVTPPLFQLSVSPGNVWQSAVKVVNANAYPITVYAEVVNFVAKGEAGQGRFIPIEGDGSEKKTLAEWIDLVKGPHTIAAGQSKDVPFFIGVPVDAPPGGHYAAILVSTEPSAPSGTQSVQTVQSVTSLFFLRIQGDVTELGTIREFRAEDTVVGVPDVTLSLRFENKGNVHLQPKGDIVITNMWGTERGRIPVNYQSHFGNVLPESIRDFTFSWKSDFRITDIGRYTARATLAYGIDGVKSVDATTSFWVIPIKATLITLLVIVVFITLIVVMVRAYIRRVLTLAGVNVTKREPAAPADTKTANIRATYRRAAAPITHGVLDLRARLTDRSAQVSRVASLTTFVMQYKFFFLSLLALSGIIGSVVWYLDRATDAEHSYEVHIIEDGAEMPILQNPAP
jgi:hypothetical protein